MCGIIGIVSSKAVEHSMQSALNLLHHRGPDGNGIYRDAPIILGQVRLAIQDLSENGHQPMISADANYVIIYNGEIYNHSEIRKQLILKGVQFNSSSDTETLLCGYIHYGEEILQKINGIFAFAIYDKVKRTLFAARDPFGVKPFYYYKDERQFIFGSEIKSLMSLGANRIQYNIEAQFETLMLQWQMDEHTGFEEIKKLLPGHCLSIYIDDLNSIHIKKWYKANFNGIYAQHSEKDWIALLEIELIAAVKRQLLSDKPIAYFLSGGLDSSLLVAIAKSIDPNKVQQTFCIDAGKKFIQEGFSDDLPYAQIVAEHLQVDLEVIEAQSNFLASFDERIFELEEAQADIAPIFVRQIAKAAQSKGFNVLIGGVGGDDVCSGYRRHQAIANEYLIEKTPRLLRTLLKKGADYLPQNNQTRRIKKVAKSIDLNQRARLYQYFFWANKADILDLFNDTAKVALDCNCIEHHFDKYLAEIPNESSALNQMLHLEQNSFLPCHNLNYTDKMGMAASVEIRVPYLDLDFVKFAASIPPELKMKGMTTKYLLKKVAEKYLPNEVIYRPKTGFGAPIRTWMQEENNFQNEVWKRLSNLKIVAKNIYKQAAIEALFQDTIQKKKDGSYTLLALLAIESWMRQFVPPN
ncbi:MAG: asparagine synthase (glutamine-hydrolyzing) [Phycisphaerales bacterium]|nr:asparagine synthase (glutamine-hydrolyzing) [Phycisphaerales bacterium]